MGLYNYVRNFVSNYADLVKPLTDLTKKGVPNQLPWEHRHTEVFDRLKQMLLQEHDGELYPVIYISQKLLPREVSYSTIEKECMSIMWAVTKLCAII